MLKEIFVWAESWAPLIPIILYFKYRPRQAYLKPVLLYFFLAVAFNTVSILIWQQKRLGLEMFTTNNNPFYNTQAIVRLFLLSSFFLLLKQPFAVILKKLLPFLFLLFVVLDLVWLEYFFALKIANNIHAAEAGLLLLYCLLFYLYLLHSEAVHPLQLASFWTVTGLIIFVAVSFPIYLYYESLIKKDVTFAVDIWSVQKISFIVFCLLSAFGFTFAKDKTQILHG